MVNSGLALAAHFGDGAAARRRRRRRPGRRGRQGPGAGPRRLAGVPGDRRQGARRLEGPLPRLRASVLTSDGVARLRHPPPRPRLGAQPARARSRRSSPTSSWSGPARRATTLLPLPAHEAMRPPVALLVYAPDEPRRAVYYPFAAFSPEWQAMRYALAHGVPVRFMDLPQAHQLARRRESRRRGEPTARASPRIATRSALLGRGAPATATASAGGSTGRAAPRRRRRLRRRSSRRWPRCARSAARPTTAQRGAARGVHAPDDPRGASARASSGSPWSAAPGTRRRWPTPARRKRRRRAAQGPAARSRSRRPGCPGPTAGCRFASGYGAGVRSPGWYDHLWHAPTTTSIVRWLTRVGAAAARGGPRRLLRARDRGGAAGRGAGRAARPAAAGLPELERGDRGRARAAATTLPLRAHPRAADRRRGAGRGAGRRRRRCRCSRTSRASSGGCACSPRPASARLDLDLRKPNDLRAQPPAAPPRAARRRRGAARTEASGAHGHLPRALAPRSGSRSSRSR